MPAMFIMITVLCVLAIAYAVYSRFLAYRVMQLDDSRQTPAYEFNDGHNYHPTNKWVLFGHHFAAISGAGPLIGPVLAAQFGYLPGLLWILIGVCLGGAVQDFIVLVFSIRNGGKSLAHIARDEIGRRTGMAAMIGIIFVLVIALAGLGKVVVKALGGEDVIYPVGTKFVTPNGLRSPRTLEAAGLPAPAPATLGRPSGFAMVERIDNGKVYSMPAGSLIVYPNKTTVPVTQDFRLWTKPLDPKVVMELDPNAGTTRNGELLEIRPAVKAKRTIAGSTWGTLTIALTIPIALFTGLYMYRIRKGRVLEASIIGGLLTLGAVWLGGVLTDPAHLTSVLQSLPGMDLDLATGTAAWIGTIVERFNLSEHSIAHSMAIYGFVASVLPVWMLLCPRDYLSSFLKIGTVALLVLGVIVANPPLQAPAVNEMFLSGGPILGKTHAIFPFVFITIMCGAISGFHALVSSGTTPKMIKKESDARPIGYGAMLIEGLVGIVALIAATSLPNAHYYHMNTAWTTLPDYQQQIVTLSQRDQPSPGQKSVEDLSVWEKRTGETLTGRTGGAVTLAVGMARIFDRAAANVLGVTPEAGLTPPGAAPGTRPGTPGGTMPTNARTPAAVAPGGASTLQKLEGLIPYWYHFAIMFEALFILTTIDTGTRVGRFVLQELFGRVSPKWGRTDYWPSAILATALLVLGWWWFLISNGIDKIWPMFGIANQLLAVIALTICSVALIRNGKGRYVWVTVVPMVFVTITTFSTAVIMLKEMITVVVNGNAAAPERLTSGLSAATIVGIVTCTLVIFIGGIQRVMRKEPAEALATNTAR